MKINSIEFKEPFEEKIEASVKKALHEHEDRMIATFVPEAEHYTREEALQLAKDRSEKAAEDLKNDFENHEK